MRVSLVACGRHYLSPRHWSYNQSLVWAAGTARGCKTGTAPRHEGQRLLGLQLRFSRDSRERCWRWIPSLERTQPGCVSSLASITQLAVCRPDTGQGEGQGKGRALSPPSSSARLLEVDYVMHFLAV